ncbi:MAG: CehA/McbA family metallohydrolase [Gemmataceae bacterium]
MYTVHLRVNDRSTDKPTPVRLRITDGHGMYHAPLGRLTRFATAPGTEVGGNVLVGGRAWAYLDGAGEAQLPAGPLTVEIFKGPEYNPVRRQVQLAEGQISLRFEIDRWIDLRPDGWFAGDLRAHALSPQAAALEGAAEGLAQVHLLARARQENSSSPGAYENLLEFSGTEPAITRAGCSVVVNTLNVHPQLGTVGLLDSHRPVYPMMFGGEGQPDDWSVADWCDQCHRKRGLVTWPDLGRCAEPVPQGEALAALLLGKVDAYEIASLPDIDAESLNLFYRLLDVGMHIALVGASGKESNATVLGAMRTYARLNHGTPCNSADWIASVRRRHTFITNGPLLRFEAAGEGPGGNLSLEQGGKIHLSVDVQSTHPFDQVEILAGGSVLASKTASGNRQATRLELDFQPERSTWLVARCYGADAVESGSKVFAHSSPIWVEVAGKPFLPDAESVEVLLGHLNRTHTWISTQAHCSQERHRNNLVAVIDEAATRLRLGVG